MRPELWQVMNAIDELEEIFLDVVPDLREDLREDLARRIRRALAILHAHVKEGKLM
jgi:hypothetical protein